MTLYAHQGLRLNFAFLCFPLMEEGVPNSCTAVLLLRRVRKEQSLWNKFLLISCKGLKCVPFRSSFLRLWRIHVKGNISLEILLLWLLSHCLFCQSALIPLPQPPCFFFVTISLHHALFEAPACIPECSLFCLWPPTPSWFSSIPSAPFPLWHTSALTLLSPGFL